MHANTIATDTEAEEHSEHKHYTYTKYTYFMPITKLLVNHTSQVFFNENYALLYILTVYFPHLLQSAIEHH